MSRLDDLRPVVIAGLAKLQNAQEAAAADVPTALASATQAETLASQIATQRVQVAAWTPALSVAALAAIRDQMVTMLDRQAVMAQAFADLYRYRAANDADAVLSHQASEYLARFVFWGRA